MITQMKGLSFSVGNVTISFFGVRGSTPCSSPAMTRIGGNTSCVVVDREGEDPIILDVGTGLRYYGLSLGDQPFNGTMLLSHLHWDHVQGLPFFPQLLNPVSDFQILGPPESDRTFGEALCDFVKPPYFPVSIKEICPADLLDFADTSLTFGSATVTARPVPHTGRTNGYRIDWDGVSVAYVPDHQEPADGSIAESVLELARDVDLLIHDSQFTPELLAQRADWGHCTTGYAHRVAMEAGAKRLAMFHHDPLHLDDDVERLEAETQAIPGPVEVFAAAEGMKLTL